jgi:hypothetical protein
LDGEDAGRVSAQFVVPYPTKSTIERSDGHVADNTDVLLTSATFPLVALRFVVPVASPEDNWAPLVPPDARVTM